MYRFKLFRQNDREETSFFWQIIDISPFLIGAFVSFFGLLNVALVTFGKLSSMNVVFLGLIPATILTWVTYFYCVKNNWKPQKGARWVNLIAIALIAGWGGFNAYYSFENVYIAKDPGIYSSTARWLKDNESLEIKSPVVYGEFGDVQPDSAGIEYLEGDDSRLYVQAPHFFHTLLGVMSRALGVPSIFYMNAVIGALALYVLYGASKIFIKPQWALASVLLLGASLPMVYFSRDTYTEPITMLLVFTGLTSLIFAKRSGKGLAWLFAGLLAATSVLVRVDAYLIYTVFLLYAALLQLKNTVTVKQAYKNILIFMLGSFVVLWVAWLDLTRLSAYYFNSLHTQIISQVYLLSFVVVMILVLLFWAKKNSFNIDKVVNKLADRKLLLSMLGVGISITIFIVTRPLWLESHKVFFNNYYVEYLQSLNGLPLDGTRSYAEISHLWIIWYYSLIVFTGGIVGTLIAIRTALTTKLKSDFVLPLMLFIAVSALYINYPNITPDQIWATRRFLPVIFPAFCIFAAFSFQAVIDYFGKYRRHIRIVVLGIYFLSLLLIIIPTSKFSTTKEYDGFYEGLLRICEVANKEKTAVLVTGPSGTRMTHPIRTYCNVPTARLEAPSSKNLLITKNKLSSEGYKLLIVTIGHEYDYLPRGSQITTLYETDYVELERTLVKKPTRVNEYRSVIFLSEVDDNGRLVPVQEDNQ